MSADRQAEGGVGLAETKLVFSVNQKDHLVELEHPEIPIYRQCELLGLSRSGFYHKPVGISEYNLLLMNMIDRKYTQHPFYGILRMTAWLRGEGCEVNYKRVHRLMQLMGLRAIYPRLRLSLGECVFEKHPHGREGSSFRGPIINTRLNMPNWHTKRGKDTESKTSVHAPCGWQKKKECPKQQSR